MPVVRADEQEVTVSKLSTLLGSLTESLGGLEESAFNLSESDLLGLGLTGCKSVWWNVPEHPLTEQVLRLVQLKVRCLQLKHLLQNLFDFIKVERSLSDASLNLGHCASK